MTANDTDALQERIARAIYEAETPSPRYQWAALRNEAKDRRRQQGAAVLPIIAAEVRKAQADALRQAAEDVTEIDGRRDDSAANWIRACAADIEKGD